MPDAHPNVVVDTNGSRYELGRLLGRGGQGAVYAVRDEALAVKLLDARTPEARRRADENVARLRRLPLDGLDVARPRRALAKPYAGYVMDLMTGMVPLRPLARVPRAHVDNVLPWYLSSGGLRRRLRLLARLGDLLAELHGRGLSYGDTSPDNVFVSADADSHEVWLVDCDNIQQGVGRRGVYTPGYAAPELFSSHPGSDSLSDAWSFATIAFETLCVLHPFDGDAVHDGDPELEERAFTGRLPWVGDEDDESNRATRGLPRELVLTRQLQKLAARTFGASRKDRELRPGVAQWSERLHQAADQTLVCPGCSGTYYLNHQACPWCDEVSPRFVLVNVYLRDPSLRGDADTPGRLVCRRPGRPSPVARVAVQEGRPTELTDRMLPGAAARSSPPRLTWTPPSLSIEGPHGCDAILEHSGTGETRALEARGTPLDLSTGRTNWWLAPATPTGVHRIATFEVAGGPRS